MLFGIMQYLIIEILTLTIHKIPTKCNRIEKLAKANVRS